MMSKQKKSFLKKCCNSFINGCIQVGHFLASFVGGFSKDYALKDYSTGYLKNTNKSATKTLMETTGLVRNVTHKTMIKAYQNPLLKNALNTTQQSVGFQASKRRLISRMKIVQNKINHVNRQRDE